jgi:crossover junction endodeoxyribonuclease RuvC
MRFIAVDPGMTGAFVANIDGALTVLDMPTFEIRKSNGGTRKNIDGHTICTWLADIGPVDLVVIEEVAARPGGGVTGMFNFGLGYGMIQGILTALERPWSLVRPQVWTKALGVGPDKNRHREEAMRRFPQHADMFRRVKDDGRADAALITVWAGGS